MLYIGTHWGLNLHTSTIVREISKGVCVINSPYGSPVLCKLSIGRHRYGNPYANSEAAGDTLQASCASFPAAATIKTPYECKVAVVNTRVYIRTQMIIRIFRLIFVLPLFS